MPLTDVLVEAFNGGEISPRTKGRQRLPAYKSGSNIIENLIPVVSGGLERRPGTRFISAANGAPDSDGANHSSSGSWLIPFYISTGSTYHIELSDYKMRFYRDDGVLLYSVSTFEEAQVNVAANQFEIPAHGFYHGQRVIFTMTEGGVSPAGLVDGETYTVCLAEGHRLATSPDINGIHRSEGAVSSIDHFHLSPQMGPYNLKFRSAGVEGAGTSNTLFEGGDVWVQDTPGVTIDAPLFQDLDYNAAKTEATGVLQVPIVPGSATVVVHDYETGFDQIATSNASGVFSSPAVFPNFLAASPPSTVNTTTGVIHMYFTTPEENPAGCSYTKNNVFATTQTARFTRDKGGGDFTQIVYNLLGSPSGFQRPNGDAALVPTLFNTNNHFRLSTATGVIDADIKNSIVQITDVGSLGGTFKAAGDPPYELDTEWSYEEAKNLQWSSEADTMFFFGGTQGHAPWELLRFGAAAFVLRPVVFTGGPYGENAPLGPGSNIEGIVDSGTPVKLGALPKFVTQTGFFRGSDCGRPIRKEYANPDDALKYVDGIIERLEDDYTSFVVDESILSAHPDVIGSSVLSGETPAEGALVWVVPMDDKATYPFPSQLKERTPYYTSLSTAPISGIVLIQLRPEVGGNFIQVTPGSIFRIIHGDLKSVAPDDSNAPHNHNFVTGTIDAGIWIHGIAPVGISTGYSYRIEVISSKSFRLTHHDLSLVPMASVGSGKMTCSASIDPVTECRVRILRDPLGVIFSSIEPVDRWRVSRWNSRDGWPSACTIDKELLIAAGSDAFPTTVWGSQLGIIRDFSPDTRTGSAEVPNDDQRTITEASGWSFVLDNENTERILWLHPSTVITAGTVGPLHTIEGLSPSTVTATLMTNRGASSVRPVVSDAQIIWGSSKHHHIFAAGFEEKRAGFIPDDITKMADHLFTRDNHLIQMTLQEEPWSLIWAVREDGQLLTCTYDLEQGVQAWARHKIGGSHSVSKFDFKERANKITTNGWAKVTSISSAPSNDGRTHQVWMVTERHPPGSNNPNEIFRSIERLESRLELDDNIEDAYFVDCGAPPTDLQADLTQFSVNNVLKEQTLDAWVDGAKVGQLVSDPSGLVTLLNPAEYKIVLGIPYRWRWQSNSLESLIQDNPTLHGVNSEIKRAYIGLVNSLGGELASPGIPPIVFDFRTRATPLDKGPNLFTGLKQVNAFPGNADETNIIEMNGNGPEPWTMTHLVARIKYHDVAETG